MKKYSYNDNIETFEIDPQFLKEGIQYAEKKEHKAIRIITQNNNSGSKYNLDFLFFKDKNFIEKLSIGDDFKIGKISHIEELNSMSGLKHLSLNQSIAIDLSGLIHLESLYLRHDKEVKNLDKLVDLQDLLVTTTKEVDCQFLSKLEKIKNLRICDGVHTLDGLEQLVNLESLRITHNPKLINIDAISQLPRLKQVYFECCKGLYDFSVLKENKSITELFIDILDSLSFIKSMPELEKISFWNLKDGDLTPLIEAKQLKQFYFYPNKKHYSHKLEEIKK
ncbi:hypothetical protein [Flavobacterium sp. '19STA2R22 D10 B1']|uniref:hypothetical protein n=1 Tax=Flavobacterium aerium TaxID=3037261 RepID=UPI00278BB1C7|nr:hypothetical protein [Flavobacterium sp. '19STA2R22 D10 B1']